jgi:cytochrome c oxidase subunit 1
MISGGLEGMPRRTFMAGATYSKPSWELAGTLTAIGGTLMFVSVILFLVVMIATIVAGRRRDPGDIPFAETLNGPAASGWEPRLDRFRIWLALTILLILIAYAPFLVSYLPAKLWSTGFTIY